jgi:hypothetical protein
VLIGLSGYARSGKDTAFGFIQEYYGLAHQISFAEKLKVSAARALGFDGTAAECVDWCNDLKTHGYVTVDFRSDSGEKQRGWTIEGREYLQYYGTEAHRDVFDQDFWVKNAFPSDNHENTIWVVTDVRFPNEAEYIREIGGKVWYIDRPSVAPANEHASEIKLPDNLIDYTIGNYGTLVEFQNEILDHLAFIPEYRQEVPVNG